MATKLTKKQRDFVKDVARLGNATQAALNNYDIKSQNKENVAGAIGSENLRKPKIQEALNPIVLRWEKERERITQALEGKDLDKEQYRTLVDSLDTITKNIQLLTGGKTENTGIGELAETINNWINKAK